MWVQKLHCFGHTHTKKTTKMSPGQDGPKRQAQFFFQIQIQINNQVDPEYRNISNLLWPRVRLPHNWQLSVHGWGQPIHCWGGICFCSCCCCCSILLSLFISTVIFVINYHLSVHGGGQPIHSWGRILPVSSLFSTAIFVIGMVFLILSECL